MPREKQGRAFCITDYQFLTKEDFVKEYDADYMCGALEKCPSTGREHLQAFAYFRSKKTITGLGRGRRNNVQRMEGDALDARGYCAKGERQKPIGGWRVFLDEPCEEFWEHGDPPAQGARVDIEAYRDAVVAGEMTVDEICMVDPDFHQKYGRTMDRLEDIVARQRFRTEMTTGLWLWGPTGVGKSHRAFAGFHPDTHYVLNVEDGGWWEGYKGQGTVIINEFRGQITYSQLLQLVDKWPFTVKRRNRPPMPFVSKDVIITSSMPPEEVYHNVADRDSIEQLLRRFEVEHILAR